jgi:glutathione S-transferase
MGGWTELQAYAVCAFVLYLKFFAVTGIQATKTFQAGGRSPEDSSHPLAKGRQQNYGLHVDDNDAEALKAREVEFRWKRIVQNDLESIPLALLVFAGGVFASGSKELYVVCIALYTLSRCLHTVAYAKELQPHRAYCWRTGVLTIVVAGVNTIVGAFN